MTENTFKFDELGYFRIRIVKDATGKVEKLVGMYDNGNTDESAIYKVIWQLG